MNARRTVGPRLLRCHKVVGNERSTAIDPLITEHRAAVAAARDAGLWRIEQRWRSAPVRRSR